MFIHDALCEHIVCEDTEIAVPNVRTIINRLQKQVEGKLLSGFEHQFRVKEKNDFVAISVGLVTKLSLFGSIRRAGVSQREGVLYRG